MNDGHMALNVQIASFNVNKILLKCPLYAVRGMVKNPAAIVKGG